MSISMQEHRARMAESRRVVEESRRFRQELASVKARAEEPAPPARRRSLTFSEWKAAGRPGAQPAGGESVNLTAVGPDGRPVKNPEPPWSDYIRQEREAGRLPARSVIERAREAGMPINGPKDYQKAKTLFGGDAA